MKNNKLQASKIINYMNRITNYNPSIKTIIINNRFKNNRMKYYSHSINVKLFMILLQYLKEIPENKFKILI